MPETEKKFRDFGQSYVSAANSTNVPLAAGATWTGIWESVLKHPQIHFTCFFRPNEIPSGDATTAKGSMFFEFDDDGNNTDISVPLVVRSGIFIPHSLIIVKEYFRLKYVNDGGVAAIAALGLSETPGTPTAQTVFRLTTMLTTSATKELGRTLDQGISGSDPAAVTRAVLAAKTTDGFANLDLISLGSVRALAVGTVTPAAAAQSNVAANDATSVTLLAANAARRGATVHNDSNKALYLLLGSGSASPTVFTLKVAGDGYYECPFGFTGAVAGIWATGATGAARISELT